MSAVRRALGVASFAAALAGCGSISPSAVAVVTIAPPPRASQDEVAAQASARSRPPELAHELDDAPPALAGAWRAPGTNTRFTIEVDDGHAAVVDAVDDNLGEHYPITRSRFTRGVLSWSFRIPTTGVVMAYESAGLDGNALRARWHNDAGGVGDEVLERWGASDDSAASP